jgi:hypothetical protein
LFLCPCPRPADGEDAGGEDGCIVSLSVDHSRVGCKLACSDTQPLEAFNHKVDVQIDSALSYLERHCCGEVDDEERLIEVGKTNSG